jgi:double-stranded uracil-DNA glycosylase
MPNTKPPRPTPAAMQSARGRTVPDVIAPGLKVLFVGINPSLYSAAVGRHFARPGNRFWPVLHGAGFTTRRLSADRQEALLDDGYGITNIVAQATASAAELTAQQLASGGRLLIEKIEQYRPACVAILGLDAYRRAFAEKIRQPGAQARTLGGAALWVLPNPSGLNAHYQLDALVSLYGELRRATQGTPKPVVAR